MNDIEAFSSLNGFSEYKPVAIDLLKATVALLDKLKLDYFLISGTLLGHIRHNDFIPWDDDIDLLVDREVLKKVQEMSELNDTLSFMPRDTIIKVCFKDRGIEISHNKYEWKDFIYKEGRYNWPFLDIFTYTVANDRIYFFDRKWDVDKFFPKQKVNFLGIKTYIPKDPHQFLTDNYGSDYMTVCKSHWFCHKNEELVNEVRTIHLRDLN